MRRPRILKIPQLETDGIHALTLPLSLSLDKINRKKYIRIVLADEKDHLDSTPTGRDNSAVILCYLPLPNLRTLRCDRCQAGPEDDATAKVRAHQEAQEPESTGFRAVARSASGQSANHSVAAGQSQPDQQSGRSTSTNVHDVRQLRRVQRPAKRLRLGYGVRLRLRVERICSAVDNSCHLELTSRLHASDPRFLIFMQQTQLCTTQCARRLRLAIFGRVL